MKTAGNYVVGNIQQQSTYLTDGGAADANPDQYWRGIMIEAEFATNTRIPRTTSIGHPFIF